MPSLNIKGDMDILFTWARCYMMPNYRFFENILAYNDIRNWDDSENKGEIQGSV